MINFNNIVIAEVVKEVKARPKTAAPKNPDGFRIRLFKDGSVYPSQELVNHFNLEYWDKGVAEDSAANGGVVPNGFDVVNSKNWKQYPSTAQQFIFICATSKSLPKVDLFAQVRYREDGTPTNSVLDQGSKKPELIEMIREVYDLKILHFSDQSIVEDELFLDKNYVDLEVHVNTTLPVATNLFHIPKAVARGSNKGSLSYVRREESVFFPLTVWRGEDELGKSQEVEAVNQEQQ